MQTERGIGAARPQGGWELQAGLWVHAAERVRSCLANFRRIVGMPNYEEYVQHLRLAHPFWPIPTEREFFQLYLDTRYGNGPTRCC
jgi:uncharacterized short protein YbdD (DUF466 family)